MLYTRSAPQSGPYSQYEESRPCWRHDLATYSVPFITGRRLLMTYYGIQQEKCWSSSLLSTPFSDARPERSSSP